MGLAVGIFEIRPDISNLIGIFDIGPEIQHWNFVGISDVLYRRLQIKNIDLLLLIDGRRPTAIETEEGS